MNPLASFGREKRALVRVDKQPVYCRDEPLDISRWDKDPGLTNDFRDCSGIRSYDGATMCHRFDRWVAE